MNDTLIKVETIVKQVGDKLKLGRSQFLGKEIWNGLEVKSVADEYAHKEIIKELKNLIPGVSILSEEDDYADFQNKRPEKYWIIDPIDGTGSYVSGFDGWVVQICLVENNIPKLAVIYAPILKICYSCDVNEGAWINGIAFRKKMITKEHVILTDNYPKPKGLAKYLFDKLPKVSYLESGSLSLKAMYVLSGKADVLVKDVAVRDWDFGPPLAFANLWGGYITEINGREFRLNGNIQKRGVIVTNSLKVHNKIIKLLKDW